MALAVVDEARDDFEKKEEGEEDEDVAGSEEALQKSLLGEDDDMDLDEKPAWCDCALVHTCRQIAFSDWFMNVIMLFIVSNVITMMMESFPPPRGQQDVLDVLEMTFLVVFCGEMAVLLMALGPRGYFTNPVTAFDGTIVITSVVQACVGQAGPLTALRTLRLFRVLNKLALKCK